jgi:hypothetical protein
VLHLPEEVERPLRLPRLRHGPDGRCVLVHRPRLVRHHPVPRLPVPDRPCTISWLQPWPPTSSPSPMGTTDIIRDPEIATTQFLASRCLKHAHRRPPPILVRTGGYGETKYARNRHALSSLVHRRGTSATTQFLAFRSLKHAHHHGSNRGHQHQHHHHQHHHGHHGYHRLSVPEARTQEITADREGDRRLWGNRGCLIIACRVR